MADEKYTRDEIQRIIEQACNDAATQAVALFTEHIKEWIRWWLRALAMQLLSWLWKPAVVGVVILVMWAIYKLRDFL